MKVPTPRFPSHPQFGGQYILKPTSKSFVTVQFLICYQTSLHLSLLYFQNDSQLSFKGSTCTYILSQHGQMKLNTWQTKWNLDHSKHAVLKYQLCYWLVYMQHGPWCKVYADTYTNNVYMQHGPWCRVYADTYTNNVYIYMWSISV